MSDRYYVISEPTPAPTKPTQAADVSTEDLDRLQELNTRIARLLADAEALNNEARLLARRIYGERETE